MVGLLYHISQCGSLRETLLSNTETLASVTFSRTGSLRAEDSDFHDLTS